MKLNLITLLFIFISITIHGQETFPVNGVENNFIPTYAFINANLIISPEKNIKNGTLIIQGDKIIQADSNVMIPENAIIQNVNGDYIYPSFIDLYSDYGLIKKTKNEKKSRRPQYKSNKSGAYHWNQAIHPEVHASQQYLNNSEEAKEYLNSGFGSVLTHVQDGIFRGTGCFVLLSNKSPHENIIAEKSASFYSFKKGSSKQRYPTSLMGSIALIKQTLLDAEWYDSQEEQTNLTYSNYNLQKKLPQIFSINNVLDYQRVYKIADDFEIDFIIKGNGKEYKRIKEVKSTGFPIVVPVDFTKAYDVSNPESTEWITLSQLKDWELSPYNAVILSEEKINFCFTSSGLKNKNDFLKNIRLTIKNGLSKVEALSALTTRPADLMNISKKIGTLEKGKIANFFIASKDVFENNDAIIYENWTKGEKHILNQKSMFDLEGYYTFNSNEFKSKSVIIKKEKNKKRNAISLSIPYLDSLPLKTSIDQHKINFSLKDGSFRAIGEIIDNNTILGNYQNKDGLFMSFTIKKDSTFSNNKTKEIADLTYEKNIPTVWSPNKAFGFDIMPKKNAVIFKNATVWTNDKEGIILNTDVIINDGKIIAIGTMLNPSDYFDEGDYNVIDASSMHLTSGIIDEHSHIAISKGVNESSQSVTAEVNIGDVVNPDDHNIYRQLAGGTVAAQLLHGSANPIGGQSAIVKLRWGSSAEEMKIKNAAGFIKFALGENVKQSNWGDFEKIRFPQTRMGVEQVFYDAFYRAKEYEKKWSEYNALSLRNKKNTPSPKEDLELNILVEILNSERFITCHSYVQSEINMLMHVADSLGFTINTFTHILEGYKVADKMKKHGAGGSTFSDWWAYKFEVNDAIPHNASLLNNAGIVTAINSDDAEMGRRLNQEAAKAVKYGGASEEDAWKMITLNPAKLLHLDDRMGSVTVGKDADIVLWNENPLSVYSKVFQTYVDGKLMFDLEIDKQMRKRDLKERMRIIKLMSLDKNKKQVPEKIKEKLYRCCKHNLHEL
tara:strand:+ start:840 stop:3854 length:3015 start_codon:yes stop_codon:yes gene_type:complete